VAVAALFPSLSLTGSSSSFAANPLQGANAGFASGTLSKLFSHQSLIWGIGGLATAPVFDFGKRNAAVEAQISIRNQAYYSYQQTVITALQETEQALQTYFNEEKRQLSLAKQVEANRKVLSLNSDRHQSGLNNYTQVLQAKSIWLASLNKLTDSQQALTTDLIAIYKALGGDW
jgi:outer membrane protein, multidrug efflux system